jgi:hypothetical protein
MNAQSTPTADIKLAAVLIDTVSIQPYVFGSNKLRENIGASHIVAKPLFQELLYTALDTTVGKGKVCDFQQWMRDHDLIGILNEGKDAEIGYVGGGNAMVLFRNIPLAETFIRCFSTLVLERFPGLHIAAGIVETMSNVLQGNQFLEFRKALNDQLNAARQHGLPINIVEKPGIVQDCPSSNDGAEVLSKLGETMRWVGKGTAAKVNAALEAQEQLMNEYPEFLQEKYGFTLELENLGQSDDKGYVAVVHIDGNGIGNRFMACANLSTLRQLSVQVSIAADEAMGDLIDDLCRKLADKSGLRADLDLKQDGALTILPIRPLFVGGDDVVFVCEGKLGIYLAEEYLLNFCRRMKAIVGPEEDARIAACAGIAIVKTKYPFYRAYLLAESLMRKAKEASQDNFDSWISFLVSSSGFSGELDEILESQYQVGDLDLYGGPYCLTLERNNIQALKRGVRHFAKWPRNKMMELRDMFTQDQATRAYFLETLKSRALVLPENLETLDPQLFGRCLDMVELQNFYPQSLPI